MDFVQLITAFYIHSFSLLNQSINHNGSRSITFTSWPIPPPPPKKKKSTLIKTNVFAGWRGGNFLFCVLGRGRGGIVHEGNWGGGGGGADCQGGNCHDTNQTLNHSINHTILHSFSLLIQSIIPFFIHSFSLLIQSIIPFFIHSYSLLIQSIIPFFTPQSIFPII